MPQASIDIEAPPEVVYALVSDLPAMGRWSPECYRCDWTGGATEAAPGARFVGHNRIGWRRWSTHGTVVAADPGRELTFDVRTVLDRPVSRWSYRMEPGAGGGTRLTESSEDRRDALVRFLGWFILAGTGLGSRTERNRDTIQVTLERLKEAAEKQATAAA